MSRNVNKLAYPVVMRQDTNDSLLVTFPEIPEAGTSAHDKAQASRIASDALESALEFYFEDGRTVPMPDNPKPGQQTVALTPHISAKIARHNKAKS